MKKPSTGRMLAGSILGFLLMSTSLLLMPINGMGFLPGLLFWAGLLMGIVGQILLALIQPRHTGKDMGVRCSLITFFANPWAKVADIGLLVSLLVVALTLTACPAAYICYVALAIAAFCFCMHCICNSRVFGCVMEHDRSRRKPLHNNQREKGDGTR